MHDLINLVGYLVDPLAFRQRLGVGHVGTLLVRVVEFAGVSKEPLAHHLRHGFDDVCGVYTPVLQETVEVTELLEPSVDLLGIQVVFTHGDPLCV